MFWLPNLTFEFTASRRKEKKKKRKIELSLFNEDMGLTWYCAFDGVGLWCIVGSGVLSGHSRILAAVSSFQVLSPSPQSY